GGGGSRRAAPQPPRVGSAGGRGRVEALGSVAGRGRCEGGGSGGGRGQGGPVCRLLALRRGRRLPRVGLRHARDSTPAAKGPGSPPNRGGRTAPATTRRRADSPRTPRHRARSGPRGTAAAVRCARRAIRTASP